jgi:NADH:ubiquinone oxidoreductase subunit 3 (subunit A)
LGFKGLIKNWDLQITIFFINLILSVVLGGVLLALGAALRAKHKLDREKLRPFECGFTPKTSNRIPLFLLSSLIN